MSLVLEALGQALPKLGITFMAGLPGSGNYEIVHAARAAGVKYCGTNHEAGAVGLVDGWSRTTGEVGVAMLSQGPGLTNGLTALTEAVKSHTPMVVVAIDTPRTSRHGNLNIDQSAVCRALGAGVEYVRSEKTAVEDLARSIYRAGAELLPIVLMVPLDLVHAEVPAESELPPHMPTPEAIWPAPAAVTAAADRIRSARHPLIIAGRGAIRSGACAPLIELAERIGAVLAVSAPAKGMFAGQPFDLGIAGSFASPITNEVLGQADLVLSFGASLNAWTTGNGQMISSAIPVVQVDIEASALGAHRTISMAVQGDAAATAQALIEELEKDDWRQDGFRTPELASRLTQHDPSTEFTSANGVNGIDPRSFTIALNKTLPVERTVTIDSGHFMGWAAKYLEVPDAAGFLYPQSFQSVGLGLAVGIGAGMARSDRISVLAIGDGGWMLSPQELDTAVRHKIPLLVVIYNDSAYGAEVHRFEPIGLEVDLVRFPERDFAAMANSVGAQGVTMRALEDLQKLQPWLAQPDGPMVLDVKIDPSVVGGWVAGNSRAALA